MTDPRTTLKDAGYLAVGFGVLAFQQAQVCRRELARELGPAIDAAREATAQLLDLLHRPTD